MTRHRILAISLTAAAVAAAMTIALAPGIAPRAAAAPEASVKRPNIVFILTDDLSWNLLSRLGRRTSRPRAAGRAFDHYFVADSLCCPSRSTIFTGLFPHDTQCVDQHWSRRRYSDVPDRTSDPDVRRRHCSRRLCDLDDRQIPQRLWRPADDHTTAPVPPGWSDWHVATAPAMPSSTTTSTTTAPSTLRRTAAGPPRTPTASIV